MPSFKRSQPTKILSSLMLLLAMISLPAIAKPNSTATLSDFDFMVTYLKENYAGYPDKVTAGKKKEFEAFTNEQRNKIAEKPDTAVDEMRIWLTWFKDQHVGLEELNYKPSNTALSEEDKIKAVELDKQLAESGERITLNEKAIEKSLMQRNAKDTLAGIWETLDGTYRVAIEKPQSPQGPWLGVIVSSKSAAWSKGQIKFRINQGADNYDTKFYYRDHSETATGMSLIANNDILHFKVPNSFWKRIGSSTIPDMARFIPSEDFFLRPLSEKTLWLRLPNFSIENKEKIEKLLTDNTGLLQKTPNLLIDLRNNGGGSDDSYTELMKWLYSRPIYTIGVEFRSGPGNIKAFEEILKKEAVPDDTKIEIRKMIEKMRASKEEWILFGGKPFFIVTYNEIRPNPRAVAILMTGAGSSGEQFVLDTRSSHKVTLFGGNTQGVLDYSNQLSVVLPSGKYNLKYSSSRSLRIPDERIDNIGIPPDIRLDDKTRDQIEFVQHWLEK
jgi:hypothetical protein